MLVAGGALTRETLHLDDFVTAVRKWIGPYATHSFLRNTQRIAIKDAKATVDKRMTVWHFDFAENWSVVLPNETQGYYWKQQQVSLFTCVVTTRAKTLCFAVASDDSYHKSAFTLLALQVIEEWFDEHGPLYAFRVHVSDGASAHFKNKFQAYEMRKNPCVSKWIFSAPGHGKNACDGVGGLVKHMATTHNLRAPVSDLIQSAQTLVERLQAKVPNVIILHLSQGQLLKFRRRKQKEWMRVPACPKIRQCLVWDRDNDSDNVVLKRCAAVQ